MTLLGTIARQTVNVGFWTGVSILFLRVLDDTVSAKRKERIQTSINALTLWLADITLERMYEGFRSKRVQRALAVCVVLCYFALAIWRAVQLTTRLGGGMPRFWSFLFDFRSFVIVTCGLVGCWHLLWHGPSIFRELDRPHEALKWAARKILLAAFGAVLMIGLLVGAAFLSNAVLNHSTTEFAKSQIEEAWGTIFITCVGAALYFLSILTVLLICALVTLALIGARYPIALLAETMFRIATFRKGAWAALLLIATLVLGMVKALTGH